MAVDSSTAAARQALAEMASECAELEKLIEGSLSDTVASWLSARYAATLRRLDREALRAFSVTGA